MPKSTFPINRFAIFTAMFCAAVLSSTPNLRAQTSDEKYRPRPQCLGGRFELKGRLPRT
jgi:hypothetical protein